MFQKDPSAGIPTNRLTGGPSGYPDSVCGFPMNPYMDLFSPPPSTKNTLFCLLRIWINHRMNI